MKIYFVASISGRKKYLENYRKIVDELKKNDLEVLERTIKPKKQEVYGLTDEQKVDYYKQVLDWINKADVIVAEGSYPSMGVGYEVSLALEKGKPVIVLYEAGHAPHFLEGVESDKLQIIKYQMSSLSKTLLSALNYSAEQQDTRFNFFISPKHQNYLDWIAKSRKVPRAVYLRRLIEADMEKNKDFS